MSLFDLVQKPTPQRFAQIILEKLRQKGLSEVRLDDEKFQIVISENNTMFLHHAFADYQQAGMWQRRQIIERYVASSLQTTASRIPDNWNTAKKNVLPRVRERAFHALNTLSIQMQHEEYEPPPLNEFSDNLTLEICYDNPLNIVSVNQMQLNTWDVTFEVALVAAHDNLWTRSNEDWRQGEAGIWLSPWQDYHDVSRLFLPGLIQQLPVRGSHVALLPVRELLIVTGADDPDGLQAAAKMADKIFAESSRSMTGEAVRLDGYTWKPYLPPTAHPAFRAFQELRFRSLATDYGQQKKLLDELNQTRGIDLFVAQYRVLNDPHEEVHSCTIWAKGCQALIPRTDHIIIIAMDTQGEQKILGITSWDRAMEIAGDLLPLEADLYPPRYRVIGFPTAEQVQAMIAG